MRIEIRCDGCGQSYDDGEFYCKECMDEKDRKIADLTDEINSYTDDISDLNNQLKDADAEIDRLQGLLDQREQ